jgi:hypothetical protein
LGWGGPLPLCLTPGETTVDDLAAAAAKGEERSASCSSPAGGAAYVLGPLPTDKPQFKDLAYAAGMNTKHMLPGVEMARRLGNAFPEGGF